MAYIKIEKTKNKKYSATYINENIFYLNGIVAFGDSPVDAELNLQALLIVMKKELLKKNVIWQITS